MLMQAHKEAELPPAAASKVAQLRRAAKDSQTIRQRIGTDLADLEAAMRAADERTAAKMKPELAQLQAELAERTLQGQNDNTVAAHVNRWLKENAGRRFVDTKPKATKLSLEQIREQIAEKKNARKEISAANPASVEVADKIIARFAGFEPRIGQDGRLSFWTDVEANRVGIDPTFETQFFRAMFALDPEGTEKAVRAMCARRWPEGMSADERAAKLAKLNDELATLELQEESLVLAARHAGEYVARRATADIAAVLQVRPA